MPKSPQTTPTVFTNKPRDAKDEKVIQLPLPKKKGS